VGLKQELKLNEPFKLKGHEPLLNIYFTATCIKKHAVEFLRPFGLTDVQLNLMLLLKHQVKEGKGLSQARLSDMMLVNRANITSLIDRMEQKGFVRRTAAEDDRRYNIIMLNAKGKKLIEKVEPLYAKEVTKTMAVLNEAEQTKIMKMLEKIRTNIA